MTPAQEQARTQNALARIFQLCDRNRAAMLKAREDAKLFRRRFWWQDEQETTKPAKL